MRLALLVLVAVLTAGCVGDTENESADLLVVNVSGVSASATEFVTFDAVAIRDGFFVAVGTEAELRALPGYTGERR